MLGQGTVGAVVTLRLTGAKDTFLRITPVLRAQLRLEQDYAVEASWGEEPVFLGWIENRSRCESENVAELSRQLGECLGLSDDQQVFLKPCPSVTSCKEVIVEPLSADDWEILEVHASALEINLLDQIRIVYPKAVFPVWVDLHTCLYIQIGTLSPSASYGRLEPLTELIISPKSRDFGIYSSSRTDDLYEGSSHRELEQKASGTVERSREYLPSEQESGPDCPDTTLADSSIWNTLRNFIFRVLGKNNSESLSDKELFLRTSLRGVEVEGVFRVSKKVPDHIGNSQAYADNCNDNTVHVFLWYPEPPGVTPEVVATFGKISELPSPKRRKENAKNSNDTSGKKKDFGTTEKNKEKTGSIKKTNTFVKIVWHGFEDLKDVIEYDIKNGNTHVGKVWIPESLKKKLNINVSSAVRIQSCDSFPKIPTSLVVQPKMSFEKKMTEEDIKCTFNTWLQSSTSLARPWILGKSDHIQMSVSGETTEFLISLDPISALNNKDDIFMLCPSFLQKTKIHVLCESVSSEEEQGHAQLDQNLSYLEMCKLGGVSALAVSCYEHIEHCLMGHPLSRQLSASASGLRSGAILICGAKGSGKSTFAKAVCKEAFGKLDAYIEQIDCKSLKGKTLDKIQQTLEDGFAEASWRQPSILLLDDLDQIAGVPPTPELERSPEAAQSKHIAHALKDLMKNIITMDTHIAVIATCQSEHSLNPLLVSVQGTHLFQCLKSIQSPSQEQRSEMLRCIIQNRLNTNIAHFKGLDLDVLAKETEGFVARDFTILVERAIENSVSARKTIKKEDLLLTTSDFQKGLKGFTPLSLKNAHLHKPKDLSWNMVGGLHDVRQILKDTIELPAKYPELFANLPIRHRSGVLLYGAPGTGKTLLAGVIARESGMNFISIKGPELLSKYIGASEQAVRDVFSRAQAAKPCIIFFDEFDSLAPRRGHDNTGVTDRVVNQMLTQLDGVEGLQGVYVVAATSRPDLIDPALLRPGRLDECLYCPPPEQMSRLEILKGLSQQMLLDVDVNFQQIATMTEHFTGADLKALLYNAQLEAIHAKLAASLPHDNGSGSDSDMSSSSIIFLNPSTVSEDSGGDSSIVVDQSLALLDMIELPPEDLKSSMWRLYFGSSYESDLGNGSSPSDLEDRVISQTDTKKSLHINQQHLLTALANTRPSISAQDWKFFNQLYEKFKNPKTSSEDTFKRGQKVTLA
ncbi:peroxisomal ATPase PEX1 isoform X2 [Bombina bombina]|uniref:peroxisomal ATPase PEX1 isoform X2 n=1 Tax=Bombina bombina TaxID=8345 RepID=UPI00235B2B3E|nr:peroxisomal ATPase PEX1 isoform X2 [Bombina bombina]